MPKNCYEKLKDLKFSPGTFENAPNGIRLHALLVGVGILIVLNCVIVYCYRRFTKREMKREMSYQIETAVSQYMKIEPSDVGADTV
jgi:hypothetical protein